MSTHTPSKKHLVNQIKLPLMVNGIFVALVLPYAQQTANSHMSIGPVLGVLCVFLAGISLLWGTERFLKERNKPPRLTPLILMTSFLFWSYIFMYLPCLRCLHSG